MTDDRLLFDSEWEAYCYPRMIFTAWFFSWDYFGMCGGRYGDTAIDMQYW